MTCTRCEGFGFINMHQLPQQVAKDFDAKGHIVVLDWIKANTGHDVQVCDCCGDGENWYGEPGEHYHSTDPRGKDGPYAYNGGLCECH